jgi:anaerobic selenocysteine-containing dehydrogenase
VTEPTWHKTACIFCSLNCGLEVQLGGSDARQIVKIRGDREHPGSRGYLCEKAQRINGYQTAGDRITSPMRRRPDGSFEAVSWDVAIDEIAGRFRAIRDEHGGDKILFYGGGGQGNHLGGTYGDATLKALGVRYRSNALAQEKTGEFWVNGKMMGTGVHGDFEHCEVAMFIGKNPWHSHGFARARVVLREISKDPKRTLIVLDPRRSETAAMADVHLQLLPGTDAWCLAALAATVVQENLVDHDWVDEHTTGYELVAPILQQVPIAEFAAHCGIEESILRQTARRIAAAGSVAVFEDLGLQMNRHSTLGSYIQRLIWLLTGNFAKPGTNNAFTPFLSLSAASKGKIGRGPEPVKRRARVSPVTGSKIIIGLIPCNVMAEEILADHPDRFRAMFIESGNPVHSVADSHRMREAMEALEFSVVIDVAMTETARLAHYVLPAASQFEKAECTFFNLEVEENVFHLRHALMKPLEGTLPEAEIHARLVMALTDLRDEDLKLARRAAKVGTPALAAALAALVARHRHWADYLPVILYRTLGPQLPDDVKEAATLWALAHLYCRNEPEAAAAAGYTGPALLAAERLFRDIVDAGTGVVFARQEHASDGWSRVRTPGGRIRLALPELFADLVRLSYEPPSANPEFPFVLSAGERRSASTNTILRDPDARGIRPSRSAGAALRMCPADAEGLHVVEGDRVRVTTRRGSCEVDVEITDTMQRGHVSLPNGFGIEFARDGDDPTTVGVSTNELTHWEDRDPIAGTPWHKHVPARLERAP